MFKRINFSIGFALALAFGIAAGLMAPADAAEGDMQGNAHTRFDPLIIDLYGQLEGSIQALRSEAIALRAQADSLEALAAEADAAVAEESAQSEETLAALELAEQVFGEQVASVLDPEVIAAVNANFAKARQTIAVTEITRDGATADASYSEPLQAVLDALATLEEQISVLEGAAQQGKSTPVTRSNISNN
jgi:hypothetical protein